MISYRYSFICTHRLIVIPFITKNCKSDGRGSFNPFFVKFSGKRYILCARLNTDGSCGLTKAKADISTGISVDVKRT